MRKGSKQTGGEAHQSAKFANANTVELLEHVLEQISMWQAEVETEVVHLEDRWAFAAEQSSAISSRLSNGYAIRKIMDADGSITQAPSIHMALEEKEKQCQLLRQQCFDLSQAMVQRRRVLSYYQDQARMKAFEGWLAAQKPSAAIVKDKALGDPVVVVIDLTTKADQQPLAGPPPRRPVCTTKRQPRQPQSLQQPRQTRSPNARKAVAQHQVPGQHGTLVPVADCNKRAGTFPLESALHDLQGQPDGTQSCALQ